MFIALQYSFFYKFVMLLHVTASILQLNLFMYIHCAVVLVFMIYRFHWGHLMTLFYHRAQIAVASMHFFHLFFIIFHIAPHVIKVFLFHIFHSFFWLFFINI